MIDMKIVPKLTIIQRFALLVWDFPSLEEAHGVEEGNFDALTFAEWVRGACLGHGGNCAARFVLSVYNWV